MKKIGTVGLLVASLAFLVPLMAFAAPVPTLTVTPLTVAPGGTLTITATLPVGARISKFYWFNKGASEASIAPSTAFGCYQQCFVTKTSKYVVPSTWVDGTDYYVKIYDHANDKFIKVNITVKR